MKAPKIESTTFEPLAEGSYAARLYSIIELGTEEGEYQGQHTSNNKIRLTFELPTELKTFKEEDGERPYIVWHDFTFSMHPKAGLRKFIETWIGKFKNDDMAYDFDIDKLLGKTGLAKVEHNIAKDGKVWLTIPAIMTLPKGMVCPPPMNEAFTLYYSQWDQDRFNSFPNGIKKKMGKTPEYQKLFGEFITEDQTVGNNNDNNDEIDTEELGF